MQRGRSIIAAMMLAALAGGTASAATIGIVAPKSGPYALLGQQMLAGARAAAGMNGDTLVEIDESCDENGGATAAKALIAAKAKIAIGFLCVETLSTALPALKTTQIPAISVAVRSGILMEDALRNGWPFFRIAPAEGAEAEALAQALLQNWKAEPIAFIDDGTIYGRELVGAVRQKLEPLGIRPVFNDTFRPAQEQQIALVRRLAKTGATHVLAGGDRNDIAIILRDAHAENTPLTVMGGDAMRAADRPVALADGALAVALPDFAALPSAAGAIAAIHAEKQEAEGYALPSFAAAEIAHQALAAGAAPMATLLSQNFSTAIGTIAFDENHELRQNPYILQQWRDDQFVQDRAATD